MDAGTIPTPQVSIIELLANEPQGISAMDNATASETTVVAEPITLADHEALSQSRYEHLSKKLKHLKGTIMTDNVNVYGKDPMAGVLPLLMGNQGNNAGAIGGGLGAGLLGGILGGALLNRGGLFGGNVDGGAAAATLVTENAIAASERLNMARFDAEAQRDIEAAIERTASATQLAMATGNAALGVEVAKGAGEVNTQIALTTGNLNTQGALNAAAIGVQIQKTAGDTQTQLATQTAALGVAISTQATANALATAMALKDGLVTANQIAAQAQLTAMQNANAIATQVAESKFALATAIKADGDLTRGLIVAQNDANMQRMLTTAQNEIIELRGDRNLDRRSRETEINVTQNVNQNQAQLQAQQQQQQQAVVFANLASSLSALVQQNQIIHNGIVNLGTMTASGNPTSANTRVN